MTTTHPEIRKNMMPFKQILQLPDKCPVAEIQGKVGTVYEVKKINDKNKQNFTIFDAASQTIVVSAWEHEDLKFYEGKEVLIKAGPKGGLTVNIFNGKTGLNLSRTCTLQLLSVAQAQGQAPAQPTQAQNIDVTPDVKVNVTGAPSDPKPIPGVTVGMSINCSIQALIESGQPITKKNLWNMASKIIRVSKHLEAGNLDPTTEPGYKEEEPKTNPF